ncbi:MAG TPA: hypothetical protein VFV33_19655, partial [Gemmatimonadaceae bacterium]|nr:hypothetical protein [Gemmatimonadaceae bacterium]
ARRAVTLLRDRNALLPVAGKRTVVIQYMPETELRAGRALAATLRAIDPRTRVVKISPSTAASQLEALAPLMAGAERVVLAAFVRRIEGEGRPAIPPHIADWMAQAAAADSASAQPRLVFVAFGNPYLLRQVPAVGSYLVTFGVGDALERAAAEALTGRIRITGTTPVSLPGFFARGDGLGR